MAATLKRNWIAAHSIYPSKATAENFDIMKNAGITHVELSCGDLKPWYDEFDYTKKSKAISALAREHGVETSSIHLPFAPFTRIDPADTDRAQRILMIACQSELIKAAADAGIGIAVIHPSGEPYEEDERKMRLDCALETIGALTETAKQCGMTLALENLPRKCLCRRSEEMKFFLEAIPDLRVCFDTNHSLTESNEDYIRAVGDKIVTLHVSDYDYIDEKHWLPTKGKIDWKSLISTLDEVGYQGRFLYETSDFASYSELWDNYAYLMNL